MLPMVQCLLGAASKYQMVSYDYETNAIYEIYSYSHDIFVILYRQKQNCMKFAVGVYCTGCDLPPSFWADAIVYELSKAQC